MQSVKDGQLGATSQQYPLKMAADGVTAISRFAQDGVKPANPEGKEFTDTGVTLITDDPQTGVESKDTTFAPRTAGGNGMTTETATGFEERRQESLPDRAQHLLHAQPTLGPLAVLVLAVIVFSIVNTRFLNPENLSLVLQQVTVIAMLALGQTLIILTAGIDLSAGAIAVFSSILMANLATDAGFPGVIALIAGLLLGTAMGLVNGFLVTRIKLPPFIVTLGTLSIFFALNSVVSGSETVRGTDMPRS